MAGTVGVVAIGRNEGERLRRCLASVLGSARWVVYVDSGSSDGSVALAKAMGAEVVELDMAIPFTAARARNAGFRRLREIAPDLDYVQFVDGDCELAPGWLESGRDFLDRHPGVAVVFGRLRERYPQRSVYNRLCDIEWDIPPGEARACGGNALMRRAAFAALAGFRADLIAGEEPELCVRLRAAGWRIWRLEADMGWHDAAMIRFSQWWKRTMRGGYAFAEGASLHGGRPARHYVRESWRALVWGLLLPGAIMALALLDSRFAALALAYPAQLMRLALQGRAAPRVNWLRSFFLVLGRFPEGMGWLKFWLDKVRNHRGTLIEYK